MIVNAKKVSQSFQAFPDEQASDEHHEEGVADSLGFCRKCHEGVPLMRMHEMMSLLRQMQATV